jgi:hypothetical protein
MPKPSQDESNLFRIVQAVRELWEGRSHAVRTVTLAAGAATTTVAGTNVGPSSQIMFSPKTANAAAEIGNGTMFVLAANIKAGQFIVTHANNAQTDRTFGYAAIG